MSGTTEVNADVEVIRVYVVEFMKSTFRSPRKWRVSLTLRLLMSYIYGAHILDVSRSHTPTQHSR